MVKYAINLMVCQIFLLTVIINGEKHMAQKIIANINATINPYRCPLIYYPIGDDDCESVSFYENNGCVVRTITLNGKLYRFALVPTESQEQADCFNREFSYLQQQEQLSLQQKMNNEVSYAQVVEDGYRFAVNYNDPVDILFNHATTKALVCELNNLPEQQRCICQMIIIGMTECEMANKLGISRKVLHGRKLELLRELKILPKEYC